MQVDRAHGLELVSPRNRKRDRNAGSVRRLASQEESMRVQGTLSPGEAIVALSLSLSLSFSLAAVGLSLITKVSWRIAELNCKLQFRFDIRAMTA